MKYVIIMLILVMILQTPLIIFGDLKDLRESYIEQKEIDEPLIKYISLTILSTLMNVGTLSFVLISYIGLVLTALSEYDLGQYLYYVLTYIALNSLILTTVGVKSYIYNLYLIYH